jgi:hypothetical protein
MKQTAAAAAAAAAMGRLKLDSMHHPACQEQDASTRQVNMQQQQHFEQQRRNLTGCVPGKPSAAGSREHEKFVRDAVHLQRAAKLVLLLLPLRRPDMNFARLRRSATRIMLADFDTKVRRRHLNSSMFSSAASCCTASRVGDSAMTRHDGANSGTSCRKVRNCTAIACAATHAQYCAAAPQEP